MLTNVLKKDYSSIKVLNLTKCGLKDNSVFVLSETMKNCNCLETLILDKNLLAGKKFNAIWLIFN